MSREIIMGIDVGTSNVKVVVMEKNSETALPRVVSTGLSVSQGLRRGYIVNPAETANSIRDAVTQAKKAANLNIKNAFISIGGAGLQGVHSKGSVLVSRTDHEINENDQKRSISQSEAQLNRNSSSYLLNREILHIFPVSYKIDGEQIMGDPVGMKGEKLETETFLITYPSQHLSNLIKSMELAGVTIEDAIAKPWAMSHTLLNRQEKEVGSLLINIGGDTSTIIVFEEGVPISSEVFPFGSNHITYDIARGFQVPLQEAEELKLSYDSDSSIKKKLANIIEPRLSDIFELVETHLDKINRVGLLPAGIIITGGGANLPRIDEIAKKALSLPVQLRQSRFYEDPKFTVANPMWSVAAGVCLASLNGKENSEHRGITSKSIGNSAKKVIFNWFKKLLP